MKQRGADDTNRVTKVEQQVKRLNNNNETSRNSALVEEMDRRLGYKSSPEVRRRGLDSGSRRDDRRAPMESRLGRGPTEGRLERRERSPTDRRRNSRDNRRSRSPKPDRRDSIAGRLGRKPIKERIEMPAITQRLGRREDVFDAATNKYDRNVDRREPTMNVPQGTYVDYDNPAVDERVFIGAPGGGFRGRGRGRGGFRGRGRGRGGFRGNNNRELSPSAAEDLDRELDSYMKSTKGFLDNELDSYMSAVPKSEKKSDKENENGTE